MKRRHCSVVGFAAALAWTLSGFAQTNDSTALAPVFAGALNQVAALVEPGTNEPSRTFTTTLVVRKAEGLPKSLVGAELSLALQAPDHLRITGAWENEPWTVCRDGQEVWLDAPGRQFGLLGSPQVPRFANSPGSRDERPLEPLKLPLPREQLLLLPLLVDLQPLPAESVDGIA